MTTVSILPKTYKRLRSKAESKRESDSSIINRLIDSHETLQNWDGDPYESPWGDKYRAQREKTEKQHESAVKRINKRIAKKN
jgi:hypothetical protein